MKVSVPGMPATLLNMSNNDIYKMVSGDKMDVKMNIFQRLWETLRHLFWSDKQTEAYKLLFNFVNKKAGNINASKYFTGAVNENEKEKFIHSLELFNELKTCAKNPDEMVAKGKMRWVADTSLLNAIPLADIPIVADVLGITRAIGRLPKNLVIVSIAIPARIDRTAECVVILGFRSRMAATASFGFIAKMIRSAC